jgi:hypothetical protein
VDELRLGENSAQKGYSQNIPRILFDDDSRIALSPAKPPANESSHTRRGLLSREPI